MTTTMAQNKGEKAGKKVPSSAAVVAGAAEIAPATPAKSAVALREEEILAFWQKEDIFAKSVAKNAKNSGSVGREFVFYDGPPFATGLPHYGHLLPGTMKDVIPRFKTMQGYRVARRWGWDCHGLPIENLIEKELGLATKKDIEKYGVGAFNAAAKAAVLRYADDWKRIIPRTGRWVDMEDAYKTMDSSYTESVWWSFKTLYDKGLVYEGFKSMQICPRCETTLSNFEVNQGYKDITDISVYAKFELIDEPGTFVLAWTTTPWTLPGNVALAVNPDVDYVKIEMAGVAAGAAGIATSSRYILAKSRLAVVKEPHAVVAEMKGAALVGKSYKPLFDYYASDAKLKHRERGWKIYGASWVALEEGTGIVHIAPAFGAEDMELGRTEELPFVQHVGIDGHFKAEVKDFAGQPVKPKDTADDPQHHQKADIEIIKHLAARGALFAKEKLVHSYPHCWRCETPLLNYATSSWFVKVTALKDKLVAANKKVDWVPEAIGEGRFGKWLEGARDWAVSRSRYWGAPIPVWKCRHCGHIEVVGSVGELKAKLPRRNRYYVIRHGEAESNIQRVLGVHTHAYHLTAKGREQAAATAASLAGKGIDLIITSPYSRTKETGEIVRAALGLNKNQMREDARLHELNGGIFNDKSIDEYWKFMSESAPTRALRFTVRPPGGESRRDVKKRMGDFIADIDRKHEGKTILIVTHDTPAWMLFAAAAGLDDRRGADLRLPDQVFLKNAEARPLDYVDFPHDEWHETELHRPFSDEVTYACPGCAKEMKRVPEVFDTWYDSGSMPFARSHYPFEKGAFDPKSVPFFKASRGFPADFIAEGQDQTRGWFYTLLVLSVGLFGKAPYKHVDVNGLILAEDGRKMSKSLHNYPDLTLIIDKYGADALRYFLMASPAVRAEDVNFSEKGVDEVYKKLVLRLQNVCSFYELYAKDSDASAASAAAGSAPSKDPLDRWIVGRLSEAAAEMTAALEGYEIDRGARPLEGLIDDLSTWYLRRSRERFKSDDAADRAAALATTRFALLQTAKLIAPFMPFLAEDIYGRVKGEAAKDAAAVQSVHLEVWPTAAEIARGADAKLIAQMKQIRSLVTLGLEARAKAGLKVRQPLATLTIKDKGGELHEYPALLDLLRDEVNVKEIVIDSTIATDVVLDSVLTPTLREEGDLRELIRAVQDLRKAAGLNVGEPAALTLDIPHAGQPSHAAKALVEKYSAELKKAAQLKAMSFGPIEGGTEVKLGGTALTIKVEK